MNETIESQLLNHLEKAHAMERDALKMIDDMIVATDDPEIVSDFKRHKQATYRHVKRLENRISAHEHNNSLAQDVASITNSLIKAPLDLFRSEQTCRSVSDAYATEHAEIAEYELLERIADMVGDRETAKVARENREDEQDFVRRIERNWDRAAQQELADSGVVVIPNLSTPPAAKRTNGAAASRRKTARKRTASAAAR